MSKIKLVINMLQNFKIFIISLISTFTILFPISIFTTNNLLKNNPNKINLIHKTKYIIPKEQDITVLLIISKNLNNDKDIENQILNDKKKLRLMHNHKNSAEQKYIIMKISAHDKTITLAEIPSNFKTIAQTQEGIPMKEGTLEEIQYSNGINVLKNTIENTLGIDINNTIKLDYSAISGIVNNLGGIKIKNKNSKNKDEYLTIETKDYVKILKNSPTKAIPLLKNSLDKKTKLNDLFALLSSLSYTDLTIHDLENRKKGFEQMVEEKDTKLKIVNIEIEKINDKNKLTEKSKTECKKTFC